MAGALLSGWATTCRADGWGGQLGLSSDNVLRGLTQSDHQISPQADLHYGYSGWYAGLAALGVRRGVERTAGVELIAYAGYQKVLSPDFGASVALRHYDYPGYQQRGDYNYDEAALSVNWRRLLLLTVTASPDLYFFDFYGNAGRGAAFSYELGGRQPLAFGVSADAGIGYYDLRQQIGTGYLYWSAGASWQWRSLNVALHYVGTDGTAKDRFQDLAENRLVMSVLWQF
jgi:uncharacterized protein (TIGR02001 family)